MRVKSKINKSISIDSQLYNEIIENFITENYKFSYFIEDAIKEKIKKEQSFSNVPDSQKELTRKLYQEKEEQKRKNKEIKEQEFLLSCIRNKEKIDTLLKKENGK